MAYDYEVTKEEKLFSQETDEMIIKVIGYDVNVTVDTIADGIKLVKIFAKQGMMTRVSVEKLFFIKSLYAINHRHNWTVRYYSIWREVPIH